MEKSLFRYIWTHSKRDQLLVCAVVLVSQPFYFASLDLPRQIVNQAIQGEAFREGQATAPFLPFTLSLPEWLGGASFPIFEGFEVGRIGLLLGLSGLFLFFVIINGAFKYWINVAKGVLGERMLRRLRFDLFTMVLRFTPEALRTVKSSETATIIKDEVEPVGGFIGDAFITPVFLGMQALTALFFIMVQNVSLGLMALAVVGIQFTIIPRMRRELLRLGKRRQIASRQLAGRIAEVSDGIEAVQVHNSYAWERAEIGQRLYQLFDLRLRIYNRKFIVKFINNFLSQLTPFFFYSVGGYLAIRGTLDIGQLVAVIAAYRELPPPLKELIDWDQQRLDVQVKYDQVTQHFSEERLAPTLLAKEDAGEEAPLVGPLVAEDLRVSDPHGGVILNGVSFEIPLPADVALISGGASVASLMAQILARRMTTFGGRIRIGEQDLRQIPPAIAGQKIAYAGVDPILFPGSIRDNLVYGLRHKPLGQRKEDEREALRRIREAQRTGNPIENVADEWIDYTVVGAKDEDDLDRILIDLMKKVGMGNEIYLFGLAGRIDPERDPQLAEHLVEARRRLRETFQAEGMADLVEPFDPQQFNDQSTIAENLLFGVPTSDAFRGRNLAENSSFRSAIDQAGLFDELVHMGRQIAETMAEIFEGLPPGHSLFEQFSFIGAEELPEFEAILRRSRSDAALTKEDRTRLLSLPLAYIEARHRLGLIDDKLKVQFVQARGYVRQEFQKVEADVEFYDPEKICAAAPVRDNLLFGRVSYRVANAQARVAEAISAVVKGLDLLEDIERVGLDRQVGTAGRLLTAQERASVNLVRCLVKRPDILVIDGALAPFDETRAQKMIKLLIELGRGRSLFMVLPNDRQVEDFDILMRFGDGQITTESNAGRTSEASEPQPANAQRIAGEVA
ncbi:ABC transporter ATP-binding protein [Microvirga brassicacearum]|uniref:ABC transporter ATP-binding protein n=1 Tax=Microvirga brassicacearum TaxID=2580413 RepID=A0A5N3PJ31_9HYPH|nr:ABC transporter ATP-binding protein [Microvirga brassicacearum]KAB0269750.1 ABC transporter ATP-binding protein [Microvirga brassicacearum]